MIKLENCQDATSDHLPHLCTVSDFFSLFAKCQLAEDCRPVPPSRNYFTSLKSSIQTYINYHKTHTMATHYGGMGDTSMENPESQDVDSDSQENY